MHGVAPMFALPGTVALIIFLLVRPQEFLSPLQVIPFLYVFATLAVVGLVIDVKLRRSIVDLTPMFGWTAALLAWIVIDTAIAAPEHLAERASDVVILLAIYVTIAHGLQTFRAFQIAAGTLVAACLFIAAVCFHQGLAEKQCIGGQENVGEIIGAPDGRICEDVEQCRGPEADPELEYRCEHVGMFGTFSVGERVRYRGELHDPNEVALTISAGGLALLIAFGTRKRGAAAKLGCAAAAALVVATVVMTQSRGGLVAAMLVLGVYIARRYGARIVVPLALLGLPILFAGARGGADAAMSTENRYDAWASGLDMFHAHPLVGVGARMFEHYNALTAHNSFVLALAELGLPGLVLFSCVIYLALKTLVVAIRELAPIPEARVARTWGMALLAALSGVVFQINTLSFTYHTVLWILLGFVGAWLSAIRHHRPQLVVSLSLREVGAIALASAVNAFVLLPIFLRWKGVA